MPIEPVAKVWMDGELVDWDDARIHVLTHALHYGTGVFEGIRAYETERGPAVFRLTDHIRRLFHSASVYLMEIPYTPDEMMEACRELIRANDHTSCYIRPVVYRGFGEMGLNPLNAPVGTFIVTWDWGTYLGDDALENGARLLISSWRRIDSNALPSGAKGTGQYVNSSLAKIEALKAGYEDAIMLAPDGTVAEGTGENLFLVRDGAVVTPPRSSGILSGITRDSVIAIARDQGYEVDERKILRSDVYTADEAFFTGTAAEVTPIREVDDRTIGAGTRGPVTMEIQETFFAAAKGEVERYRSWNDYVD